MLETALTLIREMERMGGAVQPETWRTLESTVSQMGGAIAAAITALTMAYNAIPVDTEIPEGVTDVRALVAATLATLQGRNA